MFVRAPVTSVPKASACRTTSATLALKISFLLGRQLMLGHDPPIQRRSTTAVRRPEDAISQVIHLPASPLPITGAGGHFMPAIDFGSFGDVSDPDVWSKVHDEGTQLLENIANIRAPMIWALEGKAHVHAEYGLLANVIVAGEDATFNDLPHFAGGIVPGDGVFTLWSYCVGPGRAQAMLLDPQPMTASQAKDLGVVAEVVPSGRALARAREIAKLYLAKTEVTRRNTRIHFVQPIKEQIVRQVGYGLALEGASAAALVKSFRSK
jgi:enoyl-CoA hydratase/carnithine racemase